MISKKRIKDTKLISDNINIKALISKNINTIETFFSVNVNNTGINVLNTDVNIVNTIVNIYNWSVNIVNSSVNIQIGIVNFRN